MEEALVNYLLADPALIALVGNRINWQDRPGAALPAITLTVVDAATEYTHDKKTGLVYPRIQFDCWGSSYGSAKRVSRAVSNVVEAGKDTNTAVFFEAIEVNNSDMNPDMLAGGTKVFRVMLEFLVPYQLKGA